MSPEHCEQQLHRLDALRGRPSDTFEYFGALADIPELVFTEAVEHALRTRTWFPTPAELRIDSDTASSRFRSAAIAEPQVEELVGGGREVTIKNPFGGKDLVLKVGRFWKNDCNACADTGWFSRQCPSEPCGRRHDHAPHEWVTRCTCYDSNPTIERRRQAQAKYSEATK